ncbi:uncharacterized protein crtam [Menidia menidia]
MKKNYMYLISLAFWNKIKLREGDTLNLSCPLSPDHPHAPVEWKNPDKKVMFFNRMQGEKDPRYRIDKLTRSLFSISVSNVTITDGGAYTCTRYGARPVERVVNVTVLSYPRISQINHNGMIVVKCRAEGKHEPPQLSWMFDNGPEFIANNQSFWDDKKAVSVGTLEIFPGAKKTTVKCFVRRPSEHSEILMDSIKIRVKAKKAKACPPTTRPLRTTRRWSTKSVGPTITSDWWKSSNHPKTTHRTPNGLPLSPGTASGPGTTDVSRSSVSPNSTETSSKTTIQEKNSADYSRSSVSPNSTVTSSQETFSADDSRSSVSPISTVTSSQETFLADYSRSSVSPNPTETSSKTTIQEKNSADDSKSSVSPNSTETSTKTTIQEKNSAGGTSMFGITESHPIYNSTDRNITDGFGSNKRVGKEGNSTLLVLLVTCLIFGLLVVVIFFAIKLRRAHLMWKRVFIVTENEDSNPSEESSKSKSSQEEKNAQGQRRRGVLNTAFTQYVVEEESPVITSVINTNAIAMAPNQRGEPPSPPQTAAKIKETAL